MKLRKSVALATAIVIGAALVPFTATSASALTTPIVDVAVNTTFNGTSTFVNQTASLGLVDNLDRGTVLATFRTTSTASAKTILSASDAGDPSSNLTLALNNGELHLEVRDAGVDSSRMDWPTSYAPAGRLNDGIWHTVAVTVADDGTRFYVDGHEAFSSTYLGFFNDVADLDTLNIGRNVDSGGGQWYFNGEIGKVQIYDVPLAPSELADTALEPAALKIWPVNHTFAGGPPDYFTRTTHIPDVGVLARGSISAEFSTSSAGRHVFLSASDTTAANTRVAFGIDGGDLFFDVKNGAGINKTITVPGSWNDGGLHTAAVVVGPEGTWLYADGYRIASSLDTVFFDDVTTLNGMWIGRDVNNVGAREYFVGEIAEVRIDSEPLLDPQLKNLADADPVNSVALFDKNYAGSAAYRIPVLLKTQAGTLLAAADQRMGGAFDAPNDINLAVRRSTDSGATWSAPQVLIDYPGSGADGASVIDSAMVQDSATGRIVLVVDHFPGGYGAPQSQAGTGFDANGRQLLTDSAANQYYVDATGAVFTTSGTPTAYTVASNGDVSNGGVPAGNIYLKDGADPAQSLLTFRTSYLKMITSDDDGLTWSDPIDLNAMVKEPWMKFLGTGPGTGIQIESGPNAGRLLIPVYYNNDQGSSDAFSNAVIFSDDGGATWELGESPNEGRVWNGVTVDPATTTDSTASLEEAAVVEMDDGTLKIWMRNQTSTWPTRKIAVATSTDGGETWGPVTLDSAIRDMASMPSAVHYPDLGDAHERIVFGNADNRLVGKMGNAARSNGVLRLSLDGGATWAHSRMLQANVYAYNSIQILDDGSIGVIWENEHHGLYFTRLPLSWLTDSKS